VVGLHRVYRPFCIDFVMNVAAIVILATQEGMRRSRKYIRSIVLAAAFQKGNWIEIHPENYSIPFDSNEKTCQSSPRLLKESQRTASRVNRRIARSQNWRAV
jgi:hypothetical protein